jgi:hypothetical protein
MNRRIVTLVVALSCALALSTVAFAHHGYAAYESKITTLKGTVTRFVIMNPHSVMEMDAKTEDGKTEHWLIETSHVRGMRQGGWKATSLKPGDEVTFHFRAAKNGSRVGSLQKIEFADGSVLPQRGSDE